MRQLLEPRHSLMSLTWLESHTLRDGLRTCARARATTRKDSKHCTSCTIYGFVYCTSSTSPSELHKLCELRKSREKNKMLELLTITKSTTYVIESCANCEAAQATRSAQEAPHAWARQTHRVARTVYQRERRARYVLSEWVLRELNKMHEPHELRSGTL